MIFEIKFTLVAELSYDAVTQQLEQNWGKSIVLI